MIVVSTLRPFDYARPNEYNANQQAAWRSWQDAFGAIFYFAAPERALESEKTRFLPWEQFPCIRDLAAFAAGHPGWSALVNADIRVPAHLAAVEARLKKSNAACAASWRWTFFPGAPLETARVNDNGLDFFAAPGWMWRRVSDVCPEPLRMGTGFWDTWMLSFFHAVGRDRFFDITAERMVFHPVHGGRQYGPGFNHREISVIGRPIMGRRLPQ